MSDNAQPVSSALSEDNSAREPHALYPLLGTPILTKDIQEDDIVLFAYDDTFSHIIPHGTEVLDNCARIAIHSNIKILKIPLGSDIPHHQKILGAINNACDIFRINMPTLICGNETAKSSQADLFKQTVRVAIPRLKQCGETLVAAITAGNQEIVDLLLQSPLVRDNIELYTIALKATAKVNDAARIHDLLADDSPLSSNKSWYSALALKEAATKGHVDLIKRLLNPTLISQHQQQLVHSLELAAKEGHLEVVRELLAISEVAHDKYLAFYDAVENGHLEIMRELLASSQVKKDLRHNGGNVFECAAENGQLAVLYELYAFENIKEKVTAGETSAFFKAAKNGHLKVVSELLAFEKIAAQVAANNNEALRWAAHNGHLDIVRLLLTFEAVKAQVAANNNEAFQWTAYNGNLDMVRLLLSFDVVKAQVAANNNGALRASAQSGHLEVVRELLAYEDVKAQVAANNNEALRMAASSGHLEVVRELLAYEDVKAQVAANNNEALRMAANCGCLEVMRELLAYENVKAEVTVYNNEALVMAAENGHLDVVRFLLTFEAVKSQVAANNNEALQMAAQNGHLEVVCELLTIPEMKSRVASNDNQALQGAVKGGHLKVVRELLNYSEVKEQVAEDNNEILKIAAFNDQLEVARELLIIPEVKSQAAVNDNKALRIAAKRGHFEIVRELLALPEVNAIAAVNGNKALKNAVNSGSVDTVRELLRCPAVRDGIDMNDNEILALAIALPIGDSKQLIVHELLCYPKVLAKVAINDNAALRSAIEENDADVINLLLTHKAVRDKLSLVQLFGLLTIGNVNTQQLEMLIEPCIRRECLSQKALWRGVKHLDSPDPFEVITRYMQYYAYQPIPAELRGDKWTSAIKHSIQHSFDSYFETPKIHAGKILQAVANVEELKKIYRDQTAQARNSESAMEESLVREAITRFQDKIEPAFQQHFMKMGGIEGIEPKIIGLLLEKKVAQLEEFSCDNSQEVINFIVNYKAALMQREAAALAQSRHYFTSHTDTFEIALRAFDSDAPSHGWEKLFVAPKIDKEKNEVFSTRAASNVTLTLKKTTDITRKILCYAYVVAQDEALNENDKLNICDALVHYMAEISRAHNNTTNGTDNPSCYPGTITRLDLIFQKHPRFTVDKELFSTTANIVSQLVVKAFSAALNECKDQASKLELYDAVTLFSHHNAREILHRPEVVLTTEGEVANLEHLLAIRKAFFEKYFGVQGQEGLKKITIALLENQLVLEEDMTEIALLPLINMSGATPTTTFSLTEAYLRSIPVEEPIPMAMDENIVNDKNKPAILHSAKAQAEKRKREKEPEGENAEEKMGFRRLGKK